MRIGKVIGTVVTSRVHPSLAGAAWKLAIPLTLEELAGDRESDAEALVVYDDLGAGPGSLIAISEGGEAAQPFYPESKPVDAYNAALLDTLTIHS